MSHVCAAALELRCWCHWIAAAIPFVVRLSFGFGSTQAFASELKAVVPIVDLSSLPGFETNEHTGTTTGAQAKPLTTTDDLHSLIVQAGKQGIKADAVMTPADSGELWRTRLALCCHI